MSSIIDAVVISAAILLLKSAFCEFALIRGELQPS